MKPYKFLSLIATGLGAHARAYRSPPRVRVVSTRKPRLSCDATNMATCGKMVRSRGNVGALSLLICLQVLTGGGRSVPLGTNPTEGTWSRSVAARICLFPTETERPAT